MTLKMTGAEYKAWIASDWGGNGSYWDGTLISVNGVELEDIEPDKVPDNADVRIIAGEVFINEDDRNSISAETHIRRWRKARDSEFLTFTVPKSKADAVREAVASVLRNGAK